MLRPRSSLPASAKPRRRVKLAARWILIPIVLATAFGMIWLFPREAVTRQQALEQKNDPIATDYLRGILKQHPEDIDVRSELVQRALASGNTSFAQELLAPLLDTASPHRLRATVLMADIQEQLLGRMDNGTTEYRRTEDALRSILSSLLASENLNKIDPEWLLAKARRHLPEKIIVIYQLLAKSTPGRAPYWFEREAKEELAAGHHHAAAEAYFQAQRASTNPDNRRYYFLEGLKTLQSGLLFKEALAEAKQQEAAWRTDREIMFYLAKLARAAGDNQSAEHYVRLLLQISLQEQAEPTIQQASWQPDTLPASPKSLTSGFPAMPFDDEVYTLAYEVFVSNQKLDDAMAVATAALRQVPNQPDWLRRLAQAAEWSRHPEEALAAWRLLATKFNDAKGWEGMARLAPGLLSDEDMLLVWQRQVGQRTLDARELREIQSIYERLARPLEGAAFFEKTFIRHPSPQLLEQAAYLRHSIGDVDGALANYQRLARTYGPHPRWATTEASLLYGKNEQSKALEALKAAESSATEQDKDFWRLLGDLAWNLDQGDTARHAYFKRQRADDWQRTDMDRLLSLLDPAQNDERLAISRAAWHRTGSLNYLSMALAILLERNQLAAAKLLLTELTADKLREANRDSDFLVQRARFHLLSGDPSRARADLMTAHSHSPSPELKSSLVWMLIDTRDSASLNGVLSQWESHAEQSQELATAIAAGWHALGNTQRALFWSRKLLAGHENDPAWLTNYADLIEQSGQPDMAWRIRRHVWQETRNKPATDIETLLRQLRLALQMESVDKGERRLFQALLAGTSVLPGSKTPERDATLIDELVYAWFMGKDDDNRARFWHWRRYARKLADPNYLALNAASLRNDRTMQQTLLERDSPAIQPGDHAVAAADTGEYKLAEEQSWHALDGSPANDDLHTQLREQILAQSPDQFSIHSEYRSGELSGWRHAVSGSHALTPSTRLELDIVYSPLRLSASANRDPADLGKEYAQNNRDVVMTMNQRMDGNDTLSLAVGRHKGRDAYTSLMAESKIQSGHWHHMGQASWNRPANDNSLLTLGGMQRELAMASGYRIAQNIDSNLRLSYADILRQEDSFRLGNRKQLDANLEWTGRQPGGLTLSLAGQHADYQPRDESILFFPDDVSRISLTLGYGLAYQEGYTKAWRPFWSGTIGQRRRNGMESAWQLGIAGSILGNDHLAIYGGRSLLKNGESSSSVNIFYRWFF